MRCEVCNTEIPEERNSVVCSDVCLSVRTKLFQLGKKYFPIHGCDNCWGDLHIGCTDKCKGEFEKMGEFMRDLWSIIRLIYPKAPTDEPAKGGNDDQD